MSEPVASLQPKGGKRLRASFLNAVEQTFDLLIDISQRERMVFVVLAAYAVLWTLYGVVQKSSQDLRTDTAELHVWSQQLAWGYWKHPPLGVFVVKIWTLVFPVEDWSFYLLGMTNASVAIWIAWKVSATYLTAEKRVIGLALLTLIPFFNFQSLVYDHNSLLMPFWALTTWFFLRSFENRSRRDSLLAGLFAGLAMLGKYWSADLLAGLALAAVLHRGRRSYFLSSAPWLTVLVGTIVIGPHVVWEYRHFFPAANYAFGKHPADDSTFGSLSAARYFLESMLYVLIPTLLVALAARPSRTTLSDLLLPRDEDRRLVCLAYWLPFLLPFLIAVFIKASFQGLWAMPGYTLFPIVLLGSPLVHLTRRASVMILAVAMLFPPLALAAAPVASAATFFGPVLEYSHGRMLSVSAQRIWKEQTHEPLRLVVGARGPAIGISLYSPDHPEVNPRMTSQRWNGAFPPILVDATEVMQKGFLFVCDLEATVCSAWLASLLPANIPSPTLREVTLARHFMGLTSRSQTYFIAAIPPSGSG
jgi:hypothetical protein